MPYAHPLTIWMKGSFSLATDVGRILTDNCTASSMVTMPAGNNLSQGALSLCWPLNLPHPYRPVRLICFIGLLCASHMPTKSCMNTAIQVMPPLSALLNHNEQTTEETQWQLIGVETLIAGCVSYLLSHCSYSTSFRPCSVR